MRVVSTNIAEPRTIQWQGRDVLTGIYKEPTNQPISLDIENVVGDEVSDRRVHGGIFKACYLFASDDYPYWKNLYPTLDWNWGMFGENLSVQGLDESKICIGDIYKLGTAIVQVTQPREPCYKLGVKFGTTKIIKQFIEHGHSGTYVRIIERGEVSINDKMILIERPKDQITTAQFLDILYKAKKNKTLLKIAINNKALPERKRIKLASFLISNS